MGLKCGLELWKWQECFCQFIFSMTFATNKSYLCATCSGLLVSQNKNVDVGPSMGFDVWQILHNSMVTRFIGVSHPTLPVES